MVPSLLNKGQVNAPATAGQVYSPPDLVPTNPLQPAENIVNKALGWLTGRKSSDTVATAVTNSATTSVITNTVSECNGDINTAQGLSEACGTSQGFKNNKGCQAASYAQEQLLLRAAALREEAVTRFGMPNKGNYDTTVTPEIDRLAGTGSFVDYACRDCSLGNVKQTQLVRFDAKCSDTTTIQDTLESKLQTSISEFLKKQRDLTGELGDALSEGSINCMSTDLAQRINAKITDDTLVQLNAKVELAQKITIADGSRSVWFANALQSTSAESVTTLVSNINITNDLYNDEEATVAQKLVDKNADIIDLAQDLEDLSLSLGQIVKSTIMQMFIVVVVLLVAGAIAFIVLAANNPDLVPRALDKAGGAIVR